MKRYIEIEKLVYQEIEKNCFGNKKRNGYRHLFGVSQLCLLYSTHFQLDQGLCAIMGLLHDYSVYKNNTSFNHAVLSSELAEKLLNILETKEANYHPLYDLDLPIETKIETIVKEIYGGDGVEFTKKAKNKIKKYTEQGLSQLPICVAKTQYSLSDQASLLGRPTGFTVKINDIIPSAGAGFLVAISGDIMRMPGLPKRPAAVNMDIDEDGKIIGLF